MTIYALSSGPGISGIAVIRISGSEASNVVKLITGEDPPEPRVSNLKKSSNLGRLNLNVQITFINLMRMNKEIW